jgi:hypothetical protein
MHTLTFTLLYASPNLFSMDFIALEFLQNITVTNLQLNQHKTQLVRQCVMNFVLAFL